jgi:hypothetical protein
MNKSTKKQVERLESRAWELQAEEDRYILVDVGPEIGVIRVTPKTLLDIERIYGGARPQHLAVTA